MKTTDVGLAGSRTADGIEAIAGELLRTLQEFRGFMLGVPGYVSLRLWPSTPNPRPLCPSVFLFGQRGRVRVLGGLGEV